MSKSKYICQDCGSISYKWSGKCDSCNAWNTIAEKKESSFKKNHQFALMIPEENGWHEMDNLPLDGAQGERIKTFIDELDRVCGGGLAQGSISLIGGDPGIGKSTLLTQAVWLMVKHKAVDHALYVSGEESVEQVSMRVERLSLGKEKVFFTQQTNIEAVTHSVSNLIKPNTKNIIVIDSIQTVWMESIDGSPGSINQMRSCVQYLVRFAKTTSTTIIIIGHVTKDGQVAGPRLIEHMVDSVFYFEGDHKQIYRVLRSIKNRFGSTKEIGIFEMQNKGLISVSNPSQIFLETRDQKSVGSCIFVGMEGTRPILIEIQTLITKTNAPIPKRNVIGWESSRLSIVLAVLQTRCHINLSQYDIYVNVAGGFRIQETGADVAAVFALLTHISGRAVEDRSIAFGEISLSGSIKPIQHEQSRYLEAEKLGFAHAFIPSTKKNMKTSGSIHLHHLSHVSDIVRILGINSGKKI